jgi:beta-N-acetylhexosaminidase
VVLRRRLLTAALAIVALVSVVAGAVVGEHQTDRRERPERVAKRSFLAGIVPAPAPGQGSAPDRRPNAPRDPRELIPGLSVDRKVAQLFLLGFRGTDLNAEIFQRLRRLDLGGVVIGRDNYTTPDALGQMAGEARVIAADAGHVRPFVMASQPGGELNSFPDLPPASSPAELRSAAEAGSQAAESAHALSELGVNGVLGPSLDVGVEGGSALGNGTYSDDPAEVSAFADAVLRAYSDAGVFAAAAHFPGLGSADQATEDGPATVGLGLSELRRRDLLPFRAAVEDAVPGLVLSHALYPMNDFTAPGSLSREVDTSLLRGELGFQGVAITDDLAEPAVAVAATVPQAAVQAIRAGADMLYVSGPVADQQAAYDAVLAAARRGHIPRSRLDEAVGRILTAKETLRLLG